MNAFSSCGRFALGLSAAAALMLGVSAASAEQIKDSYHPMVNGSPITLMKDNYLTQKLGGRLVDLDVWVGEFMKFDDNIYNSAHGKTSDTIFSTAGGFKMEADQPDVWKLRLEGQIQHNAYAKHSEYNGLQGYFHSRGDVDFSPAFGAHLGVNYDHSYDNARDVEDIFSLHRYSVNPGITLRPSPFAGVDIDYTYFGQRREAQRLRYSEYDQHTVAVRPYWDWTPNTTVYARLSASSVDPRKHELNSATSYAAALGLNWKYKDAAKLYAEAGFKYIDFDDDGVMTDSHDSVSRPTFRAGGQYALSADWYTGAELAYEPVYGAMTTNGRNSNYIDRFSGSVFLGYSPDAGRFTARLTPYVSVNSPSRDDDYQEYGAHIGVSYSVTDWFNVSAGYRYGVLKYDGRDSINRNQITLGLAATF
jgi:opacity protein-like surface antigen